MDAAARRIAVGGGKGGVGKSIVSVNVATAMARLGHKVVLVDADLGAGCLHTLLGLDRSGPTLEGLIDGRIDSLAEAMVPTSVANLALVPGVSSCATAELEVIERARLLGGILGLAADVVVIDVGGGINHQIVDCYNLADLRLLVLCPQLTSIQNAYAFLRCAVHRMLRQAARTPEQLELVAAAATAPEAARLGNAVARIWEADPMFGARVVRALDHFGARLVGNQLLDEKEGGMFHAFTRMVRELLGISTPLLGSVCASRFIHDSVNQRRPFVLDDQHDNGARSVTAIAHALLAEDIAPLRASRAAAGLPDAPGSEAGPSPDANLPRSFFPLYLRRHERRTVDWEATLATPAGAQTVRVREVSLGGALLEVPRLPDVGAEGRLVFARLPDRPEVPLVIRHVRSGERLVGVQFLVEGELPARLVTAAGGRPSRRQRRA